MTKTPIHVKFPKGRTAFLVIHGIGEQYPFETVNDFTQNWLKYFETQNLKIQLDHLLAKRRLSVGSFWTESFVRLSSTDPQQDWIIDIHEYYWAPSTGNQIQVSQILQWAEETLNGTIKFYNRKDNQVLLDDLLENRNQKGYFKFRLRLLTIFLRVYNIVYPGLRLVLSLILYLLSPFLSGRFLQSAWKVSKEMITPPLVNFVGDITLYSITDPKSPYQNIRQQILRECLTLLKAILKDKQANYDQVILVGHSLGSCIAYDTLNLLCIEASLTQDKGKSLFIDKLQGLVTFGSPLDKIAFFFREIAGEGQYIRQRILQHLYSFRVKSKFLQQTPYFTNPPVVCNLEQIRWFNYYHQKDPISGNLDYYDNLENIEMKYQASWGGEGHLGYWTDLTFYESIADHFLYDSNDHSIN
ncbi:MAG: hypothetical protein HEQ35_20330 [Gloeotrichia echinulata IR180]